MASEREESGGGWANLTFWTIILVMLAVGGYCYWHAFHTLPQQERVAECTQSCRAMGAEYVDVTRYGCFCNEEGIPFVLEAGQVGIDCE